MALKQANKLLAVQQSLELQIIAAVYNLLNVFVSSSVLSVS